MVAKVWLQHHDKQYDHFGSYTVVNQHISVTRVFSMQFWIHWTIVSLLRHGTGQILTWHTGDLTGYIQWENYIAFGVSEGTGRGHSL